MNKIIIAISLFILPCFMENAWADGTNERGAINGVLVYKSGNKNKILDFQQSAAFVLRDHHDFYSFSGKTTSGKTSIRFNVQEGGKFRINFGKKRYVSNFLNGDEIRFYKLEEPGQKYYVFRFNQEISLTNKEDAMGTLIIKPESTLAIFVKDPASSTALRGPLLQEIEVLNKRIRGDEIYVKPGEKIHLKAYPRSSENDSGVSIINFNPTWYASSPGFAQSNRGRDVIYTIPHDLGKGDVIGIFVYHQNQKGKLIVKGIFAKYK